MPQHTLEVDGVQLVFAGKRVLQGVYLKLETGRVTGLLGRNGSGKSSLMRIIHGSLGGGRNVFGSVSVERSVRVDGRWVEFAYKHGVAFVPQHGFIPGGRRVRGVMKDYGLAFDHLVSLFPAFENHYSRRVGTLSGGECKILEVYTALAMPDARFCLLDEPFSQVSPLHTGVIKTMIAEAVRTNGKGILVSDHLYCDVCATSDDLYIIRDGTTYPVSSLDDLRKYGYIK